MKKNRPPNEIHFFRVRFEVRSVSGNFSSQLRCWFRKPKHLTDVDHRRIFGEKKSHQCPRCPRLPMEPLVTCSLQNLTRPDGGSTVRAFQPSVFLYVRVQFLKRGDRIAEDVQLNIQTYTVYTY